MSTPLSAVSGDSLNRRTIKSEPEHSPSQFDAGSGFAFKQAAGGVDHVKHEPRTENHVKHESHIKRHHDEAGPSHLPTPHQRHAESAGQQRVKDEEEKPKLSGIRDDAMQQIKEYLGKIKVYL